MRIFLAALLGTIVIFFWEFVAHMLLPVGEMGMRQPVNEDIVLQAVTTGLPQPGIYIVPSIDPAKMSDAPTLKAYSEKTKTNPLAFVVVSGAGQNMTNMGPNLAKQFGSDFLGALIVTLLLGATTWTFGERVLGSLGFGVFGWLENIVPQWNWYRFPSDFMLGNLIEQSAGWLLAGIAIAWWLGRRKRR